MPIVVHAFGLHIDLKVISGNYPLDGGQGLAVRRAPSPPLNFGPSPEMPIVVHAFGLHIDFKVISGNYPLDGGRLSACGGLVARLLDNRGSSSS
ncbi:MAG TPA: hypothetical protein VFA04_01720 [Bryobacteraceae bacterium]|nr:hypothetical protein [Bryobacteraceae bacterium]